MKIFKDKNLHFKEKEAWMLIIIPTYNILNNAINLLIQKN